MTVPGVRPERVAGGMAILAGGGMILAARTLAPLPHLPMGPGVAPTVIGVGLLVTGVLLLVRRGATAARDGAVRSASCPGSLPTSRRWGLFTLTLGLPLFVALTLETFGMAIGLGLVLAPLLAMQTRRPVWAVGLAVAVSALLVGLVHGGLGRPLPNGPLPRVSALLGPTGR